MGPFDMPFFWNVDETGQLCKRRTMKSDVSRHVNDRILDFAVLRSRMIRFTSSKMQVHGDVS